MLNGHIHMLLQGVRTLLNTEILSHVKTEKIH